jgi:hypothetical protein
MGERLPPCDFNRSIGWVAFSRLLAELCESGPLQTRSLIPMWTAEAFLRFAC